jgi:hypothetical protein
MAEDDRATLLYMQDGTYDPENEFEVRWDDPEIGIDWPPLSEYILSDKDKNAPTWKELRDERERENQEANDAGKDAGGDSERPSGDGFEAGDD